MRPIQICHAAIVALLPVAVAAGQGTEGLANVRSFSNEFCAKCHGETAQKGGVNLAPFADTRTLLKQRKLWRNVVEQVKSGEMPPADAKQPTKERREAFVKWLTDTLDAADKADREKPDPGRTVVRRLNRLEYDRTVADLLGIQMKLSEAVGMPDDTTGEAFDNLAAALSVSESLMEKYFAAADLVLDKLYATALKKGQKLKANDPPPKFDAVVFARPDGKLSPRDAATQVTEKLARRAYRRALKPGEVDRLLKLFDAASAKGATYEEALRPVFKAILVSPNFLLRVEQDRAKATDTPYRVGDHELAVRLSYFLTATMPDDELSELADKGELSKPEVYEKQVARLLASPKGRTLTDSFAVQWLLLKKLPEARPSTEFFPTLTHRLRQAMSDETLIFFDKLREEDRSILELLDADYTYLNEDLAKHYGITDVKGPEFRKVELKDPNRGGLLGMSSMLTLTSHTNRTSPTLRGKYILDVILGTPPPPPPANAGQIDESKKGKDAKTFRELLAQHATQAACANCHARIDPLGFGLENFDAIGRFRKSTKEIDATGKLPGGESFDGPKELKQVLLKRKDQFVRNVTSRMLSYALARELQPSDEQVIDAIMKDLEANGYRFSRLVRGIAMSYPFQHRRNLKADEAGE